MHAKRIIQELLQAQCPSMHAKRRECLAAMTDAAARGGLGVVKMGKALTGQTSLRHRIKRCDRLLSNPQLASEHLMMYRALARRALREQGRVCIIVDWSDLLNDVSQHVLRAALVVRGRALVIYEEVHPTKLYGTASVHRAFMKNLRTVLPPGCQPIIISDAGFRATWFKMLNELGYAWIGRIRNRDMVRKSGSSTWCRCKELYADTKGQARDLGDFLYVRSNPVACRLVLIKQPRKGRQRKTVFGKKARSRQSLKNQASQREPWLLAVSPSQSRLSADCVVDLYRCRMQIEQTFRDLKNAQWGMGLTTAQTRKPRRLAALLLIAALLGFALWLIGLAVRYAGYRVEYGSRKKAATTLSILSLARHWLSEAHAVRLTRSQLDDASSELTSMMLTYDI